MELTCALVLVIVGLVTASPHGYGTKGGAAAKADARAVAGAYSGTGSLPLSIPSGAGYSGSFSQSSSSSSSSSSASSSSSTFSFSGTGATGGVAPGSHGCGSGNCNGGGAIGSQGSAGAASQAYSGANALAGSYGSKIPTSSYGQKYNSGDSQANKAQDCGPEGCQGTNYSSSDVNGASADSKSANDAKAAASSGAGHLTGSDCGSSSCINLQDTDIKCSSGNCGLNKKCTSGDCGIQNNESDKKCTSGQCALNKDTEKGSSINNDNDIFVPLSEYSTSRPSYGDSGSGCANGDCGSPSLPGSQAAPGYNKPAIDLTVPKLEPACSGSNCQNSPSGPTSPLCNGGSCDYKPSSQSKDTYTSSINQNMNKVPSSSYGGSSKIPSGSSDIDDELGDVAVPAAFGVYPGTKPPVHPGLGALVGAYFQQDSKKPVPAYTGGFGGPAGVLKPNEFVAPTSGNGNVPEAVKPAFPNNEILSKPSYSHGSSPSYTPAKPSSPNCAPGIAGCDSNIPHCTSGNCAPGNGGASDSFGSLPSSLPINPSSPACTPGNPGCISPSASGSPGTKPTYSQGISPSYPSVKPLGPTCAPGTPGCKTAQSTISPSGCATGNCAYPSVPGYAGSFNIKPSYSHGSSPSHSPVNPLGPNCTPGTPGCALSPSVSVPSVCVAGNCGSYPTLPGYDSFSSTKPSYSHDNSPSHSPVKPGSICTPGAPGCNAADLPNASVGCTSGSCAFPSAVGYEGSINSKPGYSPSLSPANPSGSGCALGTPGCTSSPSPSGLADCTTGNCGSYPSPAGYGSSSGIKPNYGSLPSHLPTKPLGPSCFPGTPGCDIPSFDSGSSSCTSGNCAQPSAPGYGSSSSIKPSYSQESSYSPVKPSIPGCAPGTPGCGSPPSATASIGCGSGNCGSYPSSPQGCSPGTPGCSGLSPTSHLGPNGFPGSSSSIKPSYSQGNSYFPVKPSVPGCAPGTPGCGSLPSATGSFDCASGNCGFFLSSPQGCTPGTPGCSESSPTAHLGHPGHPHPVSPNFPNINGVPSYGAAGTGSSLNQASFGSHGAGSIQTSYNKPASTAGAGSPSYATNVGATAGVSAHQDTKEKHPPYTGGFGAPAGILKPNDFTAPTSSYGSKPTTSQSSGKPACASGVCDAQASPSHSHSGSTTGAQASAGASASANAVAYTGGFGGPPGFLQPYDNGKVDLKPLTNNQFQGSSVHTQHGIAGKGVHSTYSNDANAVAQATAAAVSTAGVSGSDKLHGGYNHEHSGAGGCEGGCGASKENSGALGLSKTGVLSDTNTGLATAGAVSKSVASASSSARAYGGSYASSSASAHAGASVKGGYGRR